MTLQIDGVPITLAGSTLGQVLLAAQERLAPSGRVIVEVTIDGRSIVGDDLVTRQEDSVMNAWVNLVTADPRELVVETLGEIGRQLEYAADLQGQAADLLQRDQEQAAMQRIGDAMTIWQQTEEAVSYSATMLDISLDDLKLQEQTFAELTAALVGQLSTLRDLIQAHDTVGLADALAYEWPETTQRWQRMIERLVEMVRG